MKALLEVTQVSRVGRSRPPVTPKTVAIFKSQADFPDPETGFSSRE
jgi:hypothetical protein